MHSEAFRIGGHAIHWYGILAALGFLVAFWTASSRAPRGGVSRELILDLMPWLMIGAIVGARLYFVIAYWDEFFANAPIWEALMIRRGGMVWYGGFLGACVAVILYTRIRNVPLWKLADVAAPSVPLGHAFGRIGCFMHGCCFGQACSLPWAVRFPESHVTQGAPVHPTQLYEAALNVLLWLFLAWFFRRKKFDGQVFALYLVAYAGVRSFVESLRGDYGMDERFFGGALAPGQFMSLFVFTAGVALWLYLRNRERRPASRAAAGL